MKRPSIIFWSVCFLIISCKQTPSTTENENQIHFPKAAVVAARKEAADVGVAILRKGGNAFDAMIATELALAVSFPFAGNIGGGGFMVYRLANGETGSLDYREKAPLSAHRDMYLDSVGNPIPGMSTEGATAVGVPGTIAGLAACHAKFGTLPWKDLVYPAVELARNGVVVTEGQANRLQWYRDTFIRVNGEQTRWTQEVQPGDTLRYEALANTLERIAQHGKQGFYVGEVARNLVQTVQEKGGFITMEDLAAYEAVWRDPIVFTYEDLKIISMGPPSSGGVTLAQILGMLEPYDLSAMKHNSSGTIQLLTEAERRAYADRNYYLGDPDFVEIPVDTLLSEAYLQNRMTDYNTNTPTPSDSVSHGTLTYAESMETTHYSIADPFGNAVSVTTTLNGAYGSKLYVEESGFFLNNEMDDFSVKPGVPNMFGLVGAEANSIAPGKRMLSSMTPTIVERDGKLFMILGSPGGSTIITSVLQTILNVYEFGMSMPEAVAAGRFHHQHLPDQILMEPSQFPAEVTDSLKQMGYIIEERESTVIGKVDAILRLEDGTLECGADPRGDDAASGF